ncbi:MAG: hypothetical protein C0435_08640, partial [Ralstonia sp.]|nr:hypothetical protein [Ralstonia sp.]MBA4296066.1 hypothetical protein [Ralstonia sp.]
MAAQARRTVKIRNRAAHPTCAAQILSHIRLFPCPTSVPRAPRWGSSVSVVPRPWSIPSRSSPNC